MRVTKLSKTMGRTINTGDMNFIKLEAHAEIELLEGDSIEAADNTLYEVASQMLKEDLARIKKARKEAAAE